MKRQYEPIIGLGKYEWNSRAYQDKSEATTYILGFKSTTRDFQAMIVQRREKRRVRAAGQATEAPLKIPYLSETFQLRIVLIRPSFQNKW